MHIGIPDLWPEIDGIGHGVHGDGMSSNEVTTEENPLQPMETSIEAGDLTDVVADADEQAFCHVCISKRDSYKKE